MLPSQFADYLQHHPRQRSFLIGSFSSTCSTLLFQPLDLLKTRMQNIQYQTADPGLAGVNRMRMKATFTDVIRTESVIGLWRGTIPSLLRCIPGVGLYFTSLNQFQTLLCGPDKPSAGQAMLIGFSARSLASSILIPVTVIKIHFESGRFTYSSVLSAFRTIYHQYGLRGLYSGALPTILRDVPYSGIYYMFYTQLKTCVTQRCFTSSPAPQQHHHYDKQQPTLETFINFTCSLVSGIAASIITHPADVVKTQMQLDPKGFSRLGTSVAIIFKGKGSSGFFVGLTPRLMRRALMTAFTWTIFEHCIRSSGIK